MIKILKKNGEVQNFNGEKIKRAIRKSAERVCVTLLEKDEKKVVDSVKRQLQYNEEAVPVSTIHNMVEVALDAVNQNVAKSYREYRDSKSQFASMLDKVYSKKLSLSFIGDRSNANSDSALVTTQKAIVYNELNSELYKRFFLSQKEERAVSDGYLYIHDRGSRLDTMNCFSRDTRFITDKGIKSFNEFKDGETVRVISHTGTWRNATVRNYGKTIGFNKITIKRGANSKKIVYATANHRWILKDGEVTTNLKIGDKLCYTPNISSNYENRTDKIIEYGFHSDTGFRTWNIENIEPNVIKDGDMWCLEVDHDHSFLLEGGIPTGNCCIYNMKNLITGGFFMGNLDYVEPKSLDVAFDLIADVTLNAASSQYGGFTIPEIDKLLAPYAEKSYNLYFADFIRIKIGLTGYIEEGKDYWTWTTLDGLCPSTEQLTELKKYIKDADEYATNKVRRVFEQGFQSWEMKFNSVASSRGDYPFTAITFGLGTGKWESMASSVCMKVRREGQGKPNFKRPVLFPKLSFFYDKNIHGSGKELEWLYDEALECSMKTMYPDFISLTGDGYAPSIYKKYGVPISRMGCIDYSEILSINNDGNGNKYRNLMIGELFKSIKDGIGFNYVSNRVNRITKNIKNESDRNKFEKYGYIWYDGELMNQWAKDFKEYNGRKPTRGDVKEFFGYDLHRKSVRISRNIDSKLFDLWDSYLELKVVDALNRTGFVEKHRIEDCVSDLDYVRNKMLRGAGNDCENVKQLDIYFPTRKIGFEVQDFATHSPIDNEPYLINGCEPNDRMFKKGPTYSNEKNKFFSNIGINVYEIWEDEIRSNDFSIIESMLGVSLNKNSAVVRENIVKHIDNDDIELLDLDGMGINRYVKDIDGNFVKIHKIIKNKNVTDWLSIKLSNNSELLVTSDHPFITESGQTIASELFIGQSLLNENDDMITIVSINKIDRVANSYDVETSSGTFVFSGIQSHNCRAQTSPWFERGGMEPADENDKPIYEGRFNMGAISLHFSMIAAKAKKEDKDFIEVLNYYLEMARGIHKKTFDYLSHKKAATNPLGYCQGGFYGGNKSPDEELGEDFLRPMTISFGIIGLNEASVLWTGKRLDEDNSWAIKILQYINEYVERIKKEDNILYAIYGTPGESLVATQVLQFRKKYGIVRGVSDRDYVTNSFHCPVYADITPIQKQDIEYPMFHLCNGGNIGYARMRSNYNFQAFKDLTNRAMDMGFYWGNNQELNWCEKCGYSFSDSNECPKCGSTDITRIERMNGYLGFSNVRGKTMYSDTKLQEFKDRVSM